MTGGAQGIGKAIAQLYSQEGAQVIIGDIDEEAGRETSAELAVHYCQLDVACESSVQAFVEALAMRFGQVNVLVNNAAISHNAPILERSLEEWDRVLAVNLRGPYLMSRALLPFSRKAGGGSIINIASTRAYMSEANTEPYSASKGGLLALTHSLSISLAQDNVRVNSISPGWIDVTGWKKTSQRQLAQLSEADHQQHPVGRVGTPWDIAQACAFLTSDRATFITGTDLVIDGGMTVKMIYV